MHTPTKDTVIPFADPSGAERPLEPIRRGAVRAA